MTLRDFLFRLIELAWLSTHDPGLILQVLRAGIANRPGRNPFIGKVNGTIAFEFDYSLDPLIPAMYRDRYELWTIYAFRRFLKPGDAFVDVGANIGYLSAYAASLVGPQGVVHCFEPVPEYFARLRILQKLNPDIDFRLNEYAAGERAGLSVISLTSQRNIGLNTIVPGFLDRASTRAKYRVRVRRLDEYLLREAGRDVTVIKIDTEGFEYPVLKGLGRFLRATAPEKLPVLIVEVTPVAYPLLKSTLDDLHALLTTYGYQTRWLANPRRTVDIRRLTKMTDILCLPKGRCDRRGKHRVSPSRRTPGEDPLVPQTANRLRASRQKPPPRERTDSAHNPVRNSSRRSLPAAGCEYPPSAADPFLEQPCAG